MEPPVGIEPTTYSLRVNRSADCAKAAYAPRPRGDVGVSGSNASGHVAPRSGAAEPVEGGDPVDEIAVDGTADAAVPAAVGGVPVAVVRDENPRRELPRECLCPDVRRRRVA